MVKKILALLGVIGVLVFSVILYLVYFSKNRGYYQVKLGLMEAQTFRIKGKVIDQYGNPVKGCPMHLTPFFEVHPASWTAKKVGIFKTVTNEKGEFILDTAPVKITGTFYDSNSPLIIDGEYYRIAYGGDIFSLNKGQWIRGARWELPQPVVHDEDKEYIYRIAHSGPPQRMINLPYPVSTERYAWGNNPPNDLWLSLDVLTGEVKEGKCEDCDLVIHITGLSDFFKGTDKTKAEEIAPIFEFYARKGGGVQFQKMSMPINCEAPEEGYENYVKGQAVRVGRQWLWTAPWEKEHLYHKPPPCDPVIYFHSRNRQIYGGCEFHAGPQEFGIVFGHANPRGERNLNYGSSNSPLTIRLPITLPFREDIPVVDRKKIWAYEDLQKENTIIIEGEKGAVEPRARVVIWNLPGNEGKRIETIKKYKDTVNAGPDADFKMSVDGFEGDAIKIQVSRPRTVVRPDGISYYSEQPEDSTVELAPRWRLKGK